MSMTSHRIFRERESNGEKGKERVRNTGYVESLIRYTAFPNMMDICKGIFGVVSICNASTHYHVCLVLSAPLFPKFLDYLFVYSI